jgi:hypothetical protein
MIFSKVFKVQEICVHCGHKIEFMGNVGIPGGFVEYWRCPACQNLYRLTCQDAVIASVKKSTDISTLGRLFCMQLEKWMKKAG